METTITPAEQPSVETIWAMMQDTAKRMQENALQLEKMEKQYRETDKRISRLGSRLGEIIEYMVKPNLLKKFGELGFVFTKVYTEATIEDKINNIFTEIDITLEDGDKVMIVEVKSKPDVADIKEHLERMQKVKKHADLHNDKRIFFGAIAGMVVNDNERNFALKNGFYVIEPSGETFNITVPKGAYSPREW